MAEFALGLTKTAVEGTISRVKLAIEEEDKQRERVQDDLVFITGEFQMMQSFLGVANAERVKNPVVRTWVRQLRELAFDVEDCVEFVIHLDKPTRWDWVQRLVSSLTSMSRPQLALDVAVAEIKRLKVRVEDVSQRNIRYNLFSDNNDQSATAGITASTSSSTAFNILSQVWEASGKRRGTGDLKKLITCEGTDLQVISLWGSCSTAGTAAHHLGTTTSSSYIMREAYNDPEVCREFKIRAWVKLMHPFNPVEFINTLLAQFYINYHQPIIGADLSKRMKAAASAMENDELMQQVKKQRYLVVLEDVSAVVEWDAIKMYLPSSNNGSRVIVSTQHLRIALMCTGNPYQVSQLTCFSDGQSICAFSKKGSVRRSDLGEFIWQIRCGGVISVIGGGVFDFRFRMVGEPVIREVYMCIAQKRRAFEGVVFGQHSWVNVPNPFDLNTFAVRLFLNFQSSDVEAKEIAEVGKKGEQGVIERCCRYLREDDCLVVINGLSSSKDWDKIKATFLSGGPTKGSSSIIVMAHNKTVAAHCVDAQQNRVLSTQDVRGDEVLDRLLKGCTGNSGTDDFHRAHLFYNLKKEIYYWTEEFKLVGRENEVCALMEKLENPGVISVWGRSRAGKSVLVRSVYYKRLSQSPSRKHGAFSLVNVPCPFNLKDFSCRLLLDFCTDYDDSGAQKEAAAVPLMKGEVDPIQACRQRLREKKCLVVIDGLESKDDWDQIRTELLSEQPTQSSSSCIIVITREKSVAKHCVDDKEDRLLEVVSVKDPTFLIGRVKEMRKLRKQRSPGVTCLWGIAGVGKSALARSIYYDSMHYFVCKKKSWVDVPHPFNLIEFSQRLLLGFYCNWRDLQDKEAAAVGIMEGQDTIQSCHRFLRQYKCMIIIDGLASKHDWDLIKAAFFSEAEDTQRSYVIAITTSESVARHCTSKKTRVHNVKGLNTADALDLFRKIAWGGRQLAGEENKFSEDIIAKCGGLPKIIAAIGKYSAEQIDKIGKARFTKTTLTTISEDIHHDFMGKLERDRRFNNLNGLFSWMQSYFDACSDSLKPCIFYLSVFPADQKSIRRRRLVRRWIAEGYSRDTSAGGTAEEYGEKLFAQLVESSIIQQQQQTRSSRYCEVVQWQVNGFFREYIMSRPMEDNLVFALEGHQSLNSQRAGQHLTISSSWDRAKILLESMDLSRLRSFTVFGKWRSFFISADVNMRMLRVLDLEDTSDVTDSDLEQIGKLLPRLKFLSLRGCKYITCLPSSLGGLRQLQTLDIKGTSIVTLPLAITKLESLQYVRAGTTRYIADGDVASTRQPPAVAGTPPPADGDGASTCRTCQPLAAPTTPPPANGDGMSTSQQPTSASAATTPPANGTGTSTSQEPAAASAGATPPPADGDGTSSTSQPPPLAADDEGRTSTLWSSRPRGGLPLRLLSKFRRQGLVSSPHDGVRFSAAAARGIVKLKALHTLGVINIGGAAGTVVLRELKNLGQLRKLKLFGVNRKNWMDFCDGISGHSYLESLSVRLDDEREGHLCCLGDISKPPKTLETLKLYGGNVHASPLWMKQLDGLTKVDVEDLELTASTQEDIDSLREVPCKDVLRRLCVKPIQNGELRFGSWFQAATVLKIDCGSYRLAIVFGISMPTDVQVLEFHFSTTEASLELSGLGNCGGLKKVWLKGSYSEAVKQQLQEKLAEHRNKPVLKLEGQQSSPTPPSAW